MSDDGYKQQWKDYLKNKFGDNIPEQFTVNLGEIDFYLPPLHGINADSFNAIKKHNAKNNIFG